MRKDSKLLVMPIIPFREVLPDIIHRSDKQYYVFRSRYGALIIASPRKPVLESFGVVTLGGEGRSLSLTACLCGTYLEFIFACMPLVRASKYSLMVITFYLLRLTEPSIFLTIRHNFPIKMGVNP